MHLWGANNINYWHATGGGQFSVSAVSMPWQQYGVQQGYWIAGQFNSPTSGEDLIHICCANNVNIWKSNGNGTFTVVSWQVPGNPGYGMLEGSWHAGDFTGDGRTDLHHACCGYYSNTWKAKTDNSGAFDVVAFVPTQPYCMLC